MSNLTTKDLKDLMVRETQSYIDFLKEVYEHLGDNHPMSKDILERCETIEGSFLNYYESEEVEDFSIADHCRFLLTDEVEFCSGFTLSNVLGENATQLMKEKMDHIQNILDDLSEEFE